MSGVREELRAEFQALGFDVVRFAAVESESHASEAFRAWVNAGMHAEMAWMAKTPERRTDPRNVLDGASTIIMLGVNYGHEDAESAGPKWARYALHEDYHDTIKPALVAAGKRLEARLGVSSTDYRYYVDTGPVLERSWAAAAGVGFTGKNAMLISRDFGNWLFLAAIMVRCRIEPDKPVSQSFEQRPVGTLCGSCTACLDACPTGALPEPGVVDARRCISYQTIENKGMIPRDLRAGIGDRIYGCDICAEVCPWNRFAQQARSQLVEAKSGIQSLSLRQILELTPESFARIFRGTAIKRVKLRGLLRNACIVAANTKAVALLPQIIHLATRHAEPLVRAHAVHAAICLGAKEELQAARESEEHDWVKAEFAAVD
ncbi:MAG: tRNA epoxyqueuosine(34) reductase QueG [Synoicihabitans sp.]